MSGIYLPRLFPPHIAERGLLYFQQQAVAYIKPRACPSGTHPTYES